MNSSELLNLKIEASTVLGCAGYYVLYGSTCLSMAHIMYGSLESRPVLNPSSLSVFEGLEGCTCID